MKDVPKAHVYRMIRKGSIRVNGERAKAMSALTVDDLVSCPICKNLPRRVEIHPDVLLKVERSILDQTDDFIILNKPVGMVCQPGDGFTYGIADCLEEILGERIYPVHRLDRGTSGVLVLARSAVAARVLQEALQSAQKIYHTIVHGCWKETSKIYKMQLEKCDRKMVVSSQGKWAVSEFHFIACHRSIFTRQVKISTGRMHQIRVMLSELGYPVIGDALYGKKGSCLGWSANSFFASSELNFNYKGEEFSFQAPLTQEQQLCLKALYPKK